MKKPTYSPDSMQGVTAFRTKHEIPYSFSTELIDMVFTRLKPGHEDDFISDINKAVSIYDLHSEFDEAPDQSQTRDEIEYACKLSTELASHIEHMHFYSASLIRQHGRQDFMDIRELLDAYAVACKNAAHETHPRKGRKSNPMPELVFAEQIANALEIHTAYKAASGTDSKFTQLLNKFNSYLGFEGSAISLARKVCKTLSEKSTK